MIDDSISAAVARSLAKQSGGTGTPRVAVVPEGPYVIPFIKEA